MTYYEELGISPSANAAEIELAYQRIAQLLQRQQSEDKLRIFADAQLRRIEQMVSVLRDPVQRRQYDESLRSPQMEVLRPVVPKPVVRRRAVWVGASRPMPATTRREASLWAALFMFPLLGAGWFWYSNQTTPPIGQRVQTLSEALPQASVRESTPDPDEFNQFVRKSKELSGGWRATLPAATASGTPPTCQVEIQDEHGIVSGKVRFSHWPHAAKESFEFEFRGPVRTDISEFSWRTPDGSSGMLQLDQFAPNL